MEELIDLHIHTNFSDGALRPTEIIDEARKNGVKIIAIADHDTVEAYSDETMEYARINGIKLIPAVEISAKTKKSGIHVLGYNIDIHNKELREKLKKLQNARHDYLYGVGNKLKELGYQLNIEELDKIEAVTKAHIAEDIIKNPKNREILQKEFQNIPNKGEFIETIMNEGCIAYHKKETISPKEASELIRNSGGKVVLAHPVSYVHEDNLEENEILDLIREMNADGIEANYIYIDRNNKKINEIEKWNKFAKRNNLITTIGSDFHNQDGIHPVIGLLNENITVTQELKNQIKRELE